MGWDLNAEEGLSPGENRGQGGVSSSDARRGVLPIRRARLFSSMYGAIRAMGLSRSNTVRE